MALSHPTTVVPSLSVMPFSVYHSSVCRSPPPPTLVWKPGKRAGDSACSTALVSAGRSYGATFSELMMVSAAPGAFAATIARAK